jgi:hypothetical protein
VSVDQITLADVTPDELESAYCLLSDALDSLDSDSAAAESIQRAMRRLGIA